MLVDWRAAIHLVRGDQPFVSPGKDEVGEFAGVGPPRIAIIAEAEEAALLELTEFEVRRRCLVVRVDGSVDRSCHYEIAFLSGCSRIMEPSGRSYLFIEEGNALCILSIYFIGCPSLSAGR